MMKNLVDEEVVAALKIVMSYASHIEDWIVIKKELLKMLSPDLRKYFSTRDKITKKQVTNEFEENLIIIWKELKNKIII